MTTRLAPLELAARIKETRTCGDLVWVRAASNSFQAYAGGGLLDVPYRVQATFEAGPEGTVVSGDVAPSGRLALAIGALGVVLGLGLAWWLGDEPVARWLPLVALLLIVAFAWRRSRVHLDKARMTRITDSVRVLVKPATPNRAQRKKAKRAARGR